MEFKNRKFTFINSVYTIKFVDRVPLMRGQDDESTNFGTFDPDSKEILIGLKDKNGKPFPEKQVMNTLRHELVHMILFEGQYLTSYSDEPLVEWLAKSIGVLLTNKLL